jgi:hypothetical protein
MEIISLKRANHSLQIGLKKFLKFFFLLLENGANIFGVGNFATKHHYGINIQVNSPPTFRGMLSLPVISPLYFPELIYSYLPIRTAPADGRHKYFCIWDRKIKTSQCMYIEKQFII